MDGEWDKRHGCTGEFTPGTRRFTYNIPQYGPDLYILDLIYGTPRCPEDTDDDWLSGKPVQSVLKHLDDFDTRCVAFLQYFMQLIEYLREW